MGLCWEAFSINREVTELDEHCFESFRTALIKYADDNSPAPDNTISSRPVKRSTPPSVTPPTKRTHINHRANASSTSQQVPDSIDDGRRRLSLCPELPKSSANTTTSSYEERKDVGKVVQSWNPYNLPEHVGQHVLKKPRCFISTCDFTNNIKHSFRHMNTTIEEEARILDQHMVQLGEKMTERYGLGDDKATECEVSTNAVASLEAVGVPRQEPVCCIGRICNEVSLQLDSTHSSITILLNGFLSVMQGPSGSIE